MGAGHGRDAKGSGGQKTTAVGGKESGNGEGCEKKTKDEVMIKDDVKETETG